MNLIPHTATRLRLPPLDAPVARKAQLTVTSPTYAARQVIGCRGRVLLFAAQGSSPALVRAWWPDLTAVTGRDLWLDDTPNLTPAYIQAQLAAYAPVGLVVVDGWELLLLDDVKLPTRRDPRLLMALAHLARQWTVPVVVCSIAQEKNSQEVTYGYV